MVGNSNRAVTTTPKISAASLPPNAQSPTALPSNLTPWSPPARMLPSNRRYTSPHTARPTAPAPHPSLVFEIRIFIRRTGRAEPRRMVPRFAIAMSCEDYRTNPILAVTYFTSLIESEVSCTATLPHLSLIPQRDHRVHPQSPPRRQIARQKRHAGEHRRNRTEHHRIGRLHAIQQARHQPRQPVSRGQPHHDPRAGQRHGLPHDHVP